MSSSSVDEVDIARLHEPHPKIRAEDWRSPLVGRLLGSTNYTDGYRIVSDSYRRGTGPAITSNTKYFWRGLKQDFDRCFNTYQEPILTEYATLAVACVLIHSRAHSEITEVTRRGEKVDYWVGEKEFLLEVSGRVGCNLDELCDEKANNQLRHNPFEKDGFVCVVDYATRQARLWFYLFK